MTFTLTYNCQTIVIEAGDYEAARAQLESSKPGATVTAVEVKKRCL